jgi:hypothetical protein
MKKRTTYMELKCQSVKIAKESGPIEEIKLAQS